MDHQSHQHGPHGSRGPPVSVDPPTDPTYQRARPDQMRENKVPYVPVFAKTQTNTHTHTHESKLPPIVHCLCEVATEKTGFQKKAGDAPNDSRSRMRNTMLRWTAYHVWWALGKRWKWMGLEFGCMTKSGRGGFGRWAQSVCSET